jgi:hypothetical protein
MYAILPRIELPDVVLSSTLDHESESTSLIDKGRPSLKHAHNHDTDHDASITSKKTKRQHHYDCVHSNTSIKHGHVDNDKTMSNNSNSSAAEIGSALTSVTTATAAQDNANNTEKLGIEICSYVLGRKWLRRYDELVAFKRQCGHCNVPQKFQENKPLGIWVKNQRKQYRLLCKGESSHMTVERIDALEKVGFEWGLNNLSSWQTRYDELIAFKQQHGHCNVPRSYAQNKALGDWVMTQRYHYGLLSKGESSQMTAERIAALEKIGFLKRFDLSEEKLDNDSSCQTRYD